SFVRVVVDLDLDPVAGERRQVERLGGEAADEAGPAVLVVVVAESDGLRIGNGDVVERPRRRGDDRMDSGVDVDDVDGGAVVVLVGYWLDVGQQRERQGRASRRVQEERG